MEQAPAQAHDGHPLPLVLLDGLARGGARLARRLGRRAADLVRDEARDLRRQLHEDRCQIRCHAHRLAAAVRAGPDRAADALRPAPDAAFPQFARLPAEIRLQIWEAALPGQRAIMLVSPFPTTAERLRGKLGLGPPARHPPGMPAVFRGSAPPPALLHVNAEARAVALRRYRLGLGALGAPGRIYIDFERDCVALSRAELRSNAQTLWRLTPDAAQVRHLALPYWGYDKLALLPPLWQRCARLEGVALVRSLRWQKGCLPRGARRDFAAWKDEETRVRGIRLFKTVWGADGNLTLHCEREEVTVRYLDGASGAGELI